MRTSPRTVVRFLTAATSLLVTSLTLLSTTSSLATPVPPKEAAAAVRSWLKAEASPLEVPLGGQIKRVDEFKNKAGESLYYVVYLDPAGFVIVSADDLVEPIIAFAGQGQFDPSLDNPLGALVSNDVPGRVAKARGPDAAGLQGPYLKARQKWQRLGAADQGGPGLESGIPNVPDVRVAPFVQSRWSQSAVSGLACYNYYTPPYAGGNADNYVCGCVATAMAQLMRYHEHPTASVGTASFSITVDGAGTTRRLRGGNGSGGPYSWADMPLDPSSPTTTQLRAIGALTHDAGVSVNMDYSDHGSGTDTLRAKDAFVGTFQYSRAVEGYNGGSTIGSGLSAMINPNLHARYPVLLGIKGSLGGHAIVCDGYGYSVLTLYHHLNLGWSGSDDAWYALPTIDTGIGTFTSVYKCVYNVFVTGSGEIIAGRVLDSTGTPVASASVTATRSGGGTYAVTTDAKGIYALAGIPSASQYAILVSKSGYTSATGNYSTGTSNDSGATSGNYWGADFTLTAIGPVPPSIMVQPASQSVQVGATVTFAVNASGTLPLGYYWRRNGTPIAGANGSSYTLSNVQLTINGSRFSCLVSNSGGVTTSQEASLTVGQAYLFTTLAGLPGGQGSADGTGSAARFYTPYGVAVDSAGNLFVADRYNQNIRKVTAGGVVTTLAGSAGIAGTNDGTGSAARFYNPASVAVDNAGNVFVADQENNAIRKVTAAGVVTTLAGIAGVGGTTDGTGSAARFNYPYGVAVDNLGNVFVTDQYSHTIRKVTAQGVVTTLAGKAEASGTADGTGSAARFKSPNGVAVDGAGNVFVADQSNHTIRKVTAAGVVTTLAGSAGVAGTNDGTGSAARFWYPHGVAVDPAGNVFVADDSHRIRKVSAAGVVTTLAGTARASGTADGTGSAARFYSPHGVGVDTAGNLFVVDSMNHTIRKVTAAGVVTTLAGSAPASGDADGTGSAARFYRATGAAVDGAGDVFVADQDNHTIREVAAGGVVTTLAGSARSWGTSDGTDSTARFNFPSGVAVDSVGNVFVADQFNCTIRKVTAGGVVTTFAGSPGAWGTNDGTGSAARFYNPWGVAVDGAGNVFVTDRYNHTIRKVTAGGVVTTLAGSAGASGTNDGTGSTARFQYPVGVAVDSTGNVFVADSENHTIRKVTAAGVVTTLAGSAGAPGTADGTGSAARFQYPMGVAVDSAGNLFVADTYNHTIRKVTAAGVVTTVGGQAGIGGCRDGAGTAAVFGYPAGIAVDPYGRLFIADMFENVIRPGTPDGAGVPPFVTTHPFSQIIPIGSNATFAVCANGTGPFSYRWHRGATNLVNGGRISGATTTALTISDAQLGDTGDYYVTVSNAVGSVNSVSATLTVGGTVWAVTASASSESASSDWSASQAIGPPDTTACRDTRTAWAPLSSGSDPEWLEVGFGPPVRAIGLQVHETYCAGFIYQVDLVDTNGVYHTVWTGTDTTPCPGWFTLTFPRTSYLVRKARISTQKPGWEEVDAVGLLVAAADLSVTRPKLGSAQRLGNGQFRFTLVGAPGGSYTIQISTNLVQWSTLTNLVNPTGTMVFSDTALGAPRRFYRCMVTP